MARLVFAAVAVVVIAALLAAWIYTSGNAGSGGPSASPYMTSPEVQAIYGNGVYHEMPFNASQMQQRRGRAPQTCPYGSRRATS